MWHPQPNLPRDWYPPPGDGMVSELDFMDVDGPQDDSHNLCGLGVGGSTTTVCPERVGESQVYVTGDNGPCPVTSSGSYPTNLSTESKLPIICFQSQGLPPVD